MPDWHGPNVPMYSCESNACSDKKPSICMKFQFSNKSKNLSQKLGKLLTSTIIVCDSTYYMKVVKSCRNRGKRSTPKQSRKISNCPRIVYNCT